MPPYSNTTLVTVHRVQMLQVCLRSVVFKYNTCYCSSYMDNYPEFIPANSNTTLVTVHRQCSSGIPPATPGFKYNTCYCSSGSFWIVQLEVRYSNTTLVTVHRWFNHIPRRWMDIQIQHLLLFIHYQLPPRL